MAERWWVISESALKDALRRVAEGTDSGLVLLELFANSEHYKESDDG